MIHADHVQQQTQPSGEHWASRPPESPRSRGIYIILGLLFGLLGFHNFYIGRLGVGAAQLITVLVLGWFVVGLVIVAVWVLIELFVVTKDGKGRALS